MRRDMDLVRKLLLHLEERESVAMEPDPKIEGYSRTDIQYHLHLLAQAGFIAHEATRSTTNPDRLIKVTPFGLTWSGHEFLDSARNDTLWNKAKVKLLGVTGGLSLSLLQALLTQYARQELGLGS